MDSPNNFRPQDDEGSERKQNGSIYQSIPKLFESIRRPIMGDDILERILESTKRDKSVEWKTWDKGISSIVNADAQAQPRTPGRSRRQRINWIDRFDDFAVKCKIYSPRSDPRWCPEVNQIRANFIREQCIKMGDMYGPNAIAAVTGYGTPRSTDKCPSGLECNDEDDDVKETILWARSKTTQLKNRGSESSASSLTNSPRNEQLGACGTNTLERSNRSITDALCAVQDTVGELKMTIRNFYENLGHEDEARSKRHENAAVVPIAKINLDVTSQPFLVGSGVSTRGNARQSSVRRQHRRKRVPGCNKNRCVPKTQVVLDKRHKGPKIQGCYNDKDIISNDQEEGDGPRTPRIRTAVLPYPQSKYKHTI